MKSFKNMTRKELASEKRQAGKLLMGKFPLYCIALVGYEFYLNDRRIWKYELFDMGYRVEDILSGLTDIKCVRK